jgi:hypothetical protein
MQLRIPFTRTPPRRARNVTHYHVIMVRAAAHSFGSESKLLPLRTPEPKSYQRNCVDVDASTSALVIGISFAYKSLNLRLNSANSAYFFKFASGASSSTSTRLITAATAVRAAFLTPTVSLDSALPTCSRATKFAAGLLTGENDWP